MKLSRHSWTFFFLLLCCIVNFVFLLPNGWKAAQAFRDASGLSNPERRILQGGHWHRVVTQVASQIPLEASVRLVSAAPPWYLSYYLYPRLLKNGSRVLSERDEVRKRYPSAWVLVYVLPPHAELTAYPPLVPIHE